MASFSHLCSTPSHGFFTHLNPNHTHTSQKLCAFPLINSCFGSSNSAFFKCGFSLKPTNISGSSSNRPGSLGVVYARAATEKTLYDYTVKKKPPSENHAKDDNSDDDAFEALFSQLEEDLKNDGVLLDDFDGEISEKDLAQLELELAEALGDDGTLGILDSLPDHESTYDVEENAEDDEEEKEEEEDLLNLKTWQLRRLAYALKDGKRKISIKALAGDVCLDRSRVLKLLRDPPPNLLLMSATLPDKPTPVISEPENKPTETISSETALENLPKPDPIVKMPIHIIQSNWSSQKRLKKVQVNTLEKVYNRTKRPTNAIISSIVHVTNLPRKRVVKWFEDRRAEEGVPDHRHAYIRDTAAAESVFN